MRRNRPQSTSGMRTTKFGRFTASLAVLAVALVASPILPSTAQAATTFTVTSNGDLPDVSPGDGLCVSVDFSCTLRAAIQEANVFAGDDTIAFNLPGGAGAPAIVLLSALPPIMQPLAINGFSQPGAVQNTAPVGYNGTQAVEITGNNLVGGAFQIQSTVSLHGLVLNGFTANAVDVTGGIGATFGGNFIGTNRAGTAAVPNVGGIDFQVASSGARIGATVTGAADPSARNVISGNLGYGVRLGGTTANARFTNNYIGTDKAGLLAIPNGFGITAGNVGASITGLSIGDGLPNFRNVISGNSGSAIVLFENASGSYVAGNYVGVGADGTTPLANGAAGGPAIDVYSDNNIVGSSSNAAVTAAGVDTNGNIVANNALGGIRVGGTGTSVKANSIYSNGSFGIFHGNGVFANDPGDADTGPNNQQNWPVISNASISSGQLSFEFAIDSLVTSSAYPIAIEVFVADPANQGKTFFYRVAQAGPGSSAVNSVNAAALGVAIGDKLVATATDANGNTSQFSPPASITAGALVVNHTGDAEDGAIGDGECETVPGNGVCTLRAAIQEANDLPNAQTINFDIGPLDGAVKTITLASPLPTITEELFIDASGQNGASCASWPPTLKVQVFGGSATYVKKILVLY